MLYTYAKKRISRPTWCPALCRQRPGQAFRAAQALPVGEVAVSDFSRYAPSANAGAMFAAVPVVDEFGTRLGVVALQMPADELSALVNADGDATGESVQSYLVGPDGLSRTALRNVDCRR